MANAKEERRGEIESAAKRLVDVSSMGKEYKVMGITPALKMKEGEECFPFTPPAKSQS
jgi:SAM-dependent MidA family methyltransferase